MYPLPSIKISCSKSVTSAPILIVAELTKTINIEWGQTTALEILPKQGSAISFTSVNSICRFIARTNAADLYGKTILEKTEVDNWLEFCSRKYNVPEFKDNIQKLDGALSMVTYLVGDALTLADICVWSMLYASKQLQANTLPQNVKRWFNFLSNQPAFTAASSMFPQEKTSETDSTPKEKVKTEDKGKFVDLPGAEMGKVVVRFPPEASGFLHIGHAKAALLNAHYQLSFQGKLIMRFDDTNPEKEKEDFEKVILEDVAMLQIKPDIFTYTSDHFDFILQKNEELLKSGVAYVDDTDPETMKNEREQRLESKNRNNDVSKNWSMWEEMKKGTDYGKTCCVRAKIDMNSDNGCLRDPTLYRCKAMPHPRTGDKYKVYPTYDFACPIVDSIEGVTHALRTTEYHDRDDQFFWVIDALKLRKPYIYEYSRLNMTNTVLSKRKLTWFVNEGIVDGWDDPRMPTVRGVIRRGLTVDGLKQFIVAQGSSRSVVFMEWDKIWAFNKKVIDPISPRYNAVESNGCVPVIVEGATKQTLKVAKHPKNPELGMKDICVGPRLLVDSFDAEAMKVGENATFINWGNLLITAINRKSSGEVESVNAKLNLDNKDFKKTLKVTWVIDSDDSPLIPCMCVYYDHLISKPVLGRDDDFKKFLNKNTKIVVDMKGDTDLAQLKKGDIIQIQRKGFFICDEPYDPSTMRYTSCAGPIVLFYIPDGTKDTSSLPSAVKSMYGKEESVKEKMTSLKGKDFERSPQEEEKSICSPSGNVSINDNLFDATMNLNNKIKEQGDTIRKLKTEKAAKSVIDSNVQVLLKLKNEFKACTGKDWTPTINVSEIVPNRGGSVSSQGDVTDSNSAFEAATKLDTKIREQGDLVRKLKGEKAEKGLIDSSVKLLLQLKGDFKNITGKDWTPGIKVGDIVKQRNTPPKEINKEASVTQSNSNAVEMNNMIKTQGEMVRKLKADKADKSIIDANVKELLKLKADFKNVAGMDWKPDLKLDTMKQENTTPKEAPKEVPLTTSNDSAIEINNKIKTQGEMVRKLKADKADKNIIDANVKELLKLKADFKNVAGMDWKPDLKLESAENVVVKGDPVIIGDRQDSLLREIKTQGDLIRKLKSEKAAKNVIDLNVQNLLKLKEDFKKCAGIPWSPDLTFQQPENNSLNLDLQIRDQGNAVRKLKESKAEKNIIDEEVKKLLKLKEEYKTASGKDWKPDNSEAKQVSNNATKSKTASKTKKKDHPPTITKSKEGSEERESKEVKKVTRLGLEIKKEENLADWYSQVLTKGEMIEYYDVSGCYILRPWAYSIWEAIQKFFDKEIKALGVTNCYFPMFVSSDALEREKTHIADFAPEVAWVTKSGSSELEKPIAIRPTSETVMYPSYAKWIRSHRDLPLRLNQWCSVVRWEFRNPQPFIRTREFLWQEGHTAFAVKEEAVNEVHAILALYAQVYENLLAIPVIRGRKTEKEKFAGADFTTTTEAYVPASGRGLQGATSHHLGQNFSKMFEIVYEDPETNKKQFVYQNSWGMTTRTIGAMVMIHADNTGLVLPPRVAAHQVVIVPCGITVSMQTSTKDALLVKCAELEEILKRAGVAVKGDYRDNYSPGWKFNHWELKGVPIRIELGPKDLKANQFVAVRRDTGEKIQYGMDSAPDSILELLDNIHDSLYAKAKEEMDNHLCTLYKWDDFCKKLDDKFIIMAPFCGGIECEEQIKKESAKSTDEVLEPGAPAMGAKSLCTPFEQPAEIKNDTKCINPSCSKKPINFTLFGRSY